MRKFLLILLFAVSAVSAGYAQKGQMGLGAQVNLASKSNLLGLGAHFNYGVTDAVRLQLSGDYYFDDFDLYDLNFDVHYLFNLGSNVSVYPLAGLTLEFGDFDTQFGGNIGAGIEFPVAHNLTLGAELKGQLVSHYNRFNAAFRCTYKF